MQKRIPHNRLTFGARESGAVRRVIESGHWAGGKMVARLEAALALRANVKWAVAVGSGLAALRLALRGLGVRGGDEVIVPAYSCVALANAVLALDARPIPGDVERMTWNIDPASVRRRLSRKTRAVVAVHTFGCPAPIKQLASAGLPVIEDCAHAFGMGTVDKPLGSLGCAAILSFYATKLISAGEGGAVLTNSERLADFVRDWRDCGDKAPAPGRLNDKMTDIEAALALCQLHRLDWLIAQRRRKAEIYHDLLAKAAAATGAFRLPEITNERIWYRYVVEIKGNRLLPVRAALRRGGIHCEIPVEPWADRKVAARTCPDAEFAFDHLLSLPLYPTLDASAQRRVAAVFMQAMTGAKRHGKRR